MGELPSDSYKETKQSGREDGKLTKVTNKRDG